MGNNERVYTKDTEYLAGTIRWALILGIVGIIIKFGAYFTIKLAMMMRIDESVSHLEFAGIMYTVYGVQFAGSVLMMAGFVGLARKHGSVLGWVFLSTWLVSTIWVYYVIPFVVNSPYFILASFVMFLVIALPNSYVLWTIRKSTVHSQLTIGVILGQLIGPSIAALLTFLLLDWIWPFESGMEYFMYSSASILVFALTWILTLLLFVMELRRLNQAKHLSPEPQSLS